MNLSFFTKKEFGLPVWAWAVIVAVLLYGLYYLEKKRAAGSSNSNSSSTTGTTNGSVAPFPDSGSGLSGGFGGGGLTWPWQESTTPATTVTTTPTRWTRTNTSPSNPNPAPITINVTVPGSGDGSVTVPGSGDGSGTGTDTRMPTPSAALVVAPAALSGSPYSPASTGIGSYLAPTPIPAQKVTPTNFYTDVSSSAQAGQAPAKQTIQAKTVPTDVPTVNKKGKTETPAKIITNAYNNPNVKADIH